MSKIQKEEIVKRLTKEFGYPPQGAHLVVEKLSNLAPELQLEFSKWGRTGDVPGVKVQEYTVDKLMREYGMNPIAALLTLDWLNREPENAKASLKRGHDQIVSKER